MLNEVSVTERASTQSIITIFVSIRQLIDEALIWIIVASNLDVVNGYKQVFVFISIFAFMLALSGVFLKSRRIELETFSGSDSR
jgi:hypothetical protein